MGTINYFYKHFVAFSAVDEISIFSL